MKKSFKSITSLAIALTMLGTGFVMPASAEAIDASTLIVETVDTAAETSAEIENVFLGEHYVGSGGIDQWSFNEEYATSSIRNSSNVKIGKKFWINDHGYDDGLDLSGKGVDTGIGRQITFRPTAAGQYTATRTSSSGTVYTADSYVERYVGDNWGYGGYGYLSSVYANEVKDVSDAADGYAVYTIEIASGSCLEDAYLALTYVDSTSSVKLIGSDNTHRGAIVVGVPLEDYYDTTKLGKQTVVVPLSKFEFSENEDTFVGVSSNSSRANYAYFLDRAAWRASQKIQFNNLTGMGIARDDTNPDKLEGFEVHVYDLMIVDAPATKPVLTAEVSNAGNTLTWTESGYTDTTYNVVRSDGKVFDASTETTYLDSNVEANETYTYTVEALVGEYKVKATSNAITVNTSGEVEEVKTEASTLILDDFTVIGMSDSNDTEKAKPWPFFMGDFYVSSSNGGTVSPYRFQPYNAYDRYISSEFHRWFLNDTGYIVEEGNDKLNKGRAITYRPKNAGEYIAKRNDSTIEADAYVPWYVGKSEGYDIPDEWVHDKWGFNGFRYANGVYTDNLRDLSAYADTGYIVYTINIPSGINTEGVYLAITTSSADGSWNADNNKTPFGQIAIGVPLEDYYDTTVRGWQTIKVPFSAYNFKGNIGDNDVFVAAYHGSDGVWFNQYDAYRKYNSPTWNTFTGIGIVREDEDDTVCEQFYIDVKQLAIVQDIVEAPVLGAEADDEGNVTLSWTSSGYTETTYTITKTNGTTTETIDVTDTSYVDEGVANGEYTYTVTSKVGKYGIGKTSEAATVTVEGVVEPEPETEIVIVPVDMGDYDGKAWDVAISAFDGAKSYIANFRDGANVKIGEIGVENVEADGGSVAFAIFLKTSRANVALDITME